MAVNNINHSPVAPNLNAPASVGQASASGSANQVSNPKQLLASLLVEEELEQRLPIVRNRSPQPVPVPPSYDDDGSEDWMPMLRPQHHGMSATSSVVEGRDVKTFGKYKESDFLTPGWDLNRIATTEERTEAEEIEMRVGWKFQTMHKQEAVFSRNIERNLSGAAKDDALKELAGAVAHFSKQFQQEIENAKSGVPQFPRIHPRNVVFVERMTTALNEHLGE